MKYFLINKILLIFFLLECGLLLFFSTRGVVYSDEGYVLYGAQRILLGQVPYKDFHFVYTPLSLYFTAFSYIIFGKSILAGRLLMVIITASTSIVLYTLLKHVTKNKWVVSLSVTLFLAWGQLHTPFPWPVMFALCFSIGGLYCVVKGITEKRILYFFWAGILCGFVFLSKQNFGFALILSYAIAIYNPFFRGKKGLLSAASGFSLVFGFYLMYLFISSSLQGFIDDMYLYTFRRIIIEQTLTTSLIFKGSLYEEMKVLLYLSPLVISVIAVYFTRKKKNMLFLPIFVGAFYLLGIRPTTDYIHLAPLIAIVGIPLCMLYEGIKDKGIKKGIVCILVLFVCVGVFSAYFSNFYKWEPPMAKDSYFISTPKTYLYLDDFHKGEIEQLQSIITTKTKQSDQIYVYAYLPMLYFISDRDNVTPYDLIEQTSFYNETEKKIVKTLRQKRTKVIITNNMPGSTLLGQYIQKEYNKTTNVNAFLIWEKK